MYEEWNQNFVSLLSEKPGYWPKSWFTTRTLTKEIGVIHPDARPHTHTHTHTKKPGSQSSVVVVLPGCCHRVGVDFSVFLHNQQGEKEQQQAKEHPNKRINLHGRAQTHDIIIIIAIIRPQQKTHTKENILQQHTNHDSSVNGPSVLCV